MKKFKKLRRKGFAFTLVLAMCVGSMPVTAFAEDGEASSVDTISISSGGEISVNGKAAAEPVSASVESDTKDEGSGNTNESANTNTLSETGGENNADNAGNTTQDSEGQSDASENDTDVKAATENEIAADNMAAAPVVNSAPAKAPAAANNVPDQTDTPKAPETTEQKEQTESTVDTVKLPEEVKIEINTGETKTETVKPAGVPDGVKPDEKGNYTWTEVTNKGGEDKTTESVPVPTEEELEKEWIKGESKTETFTDTDGKECEKVVVTYTKDGVTYTKTTITHKTGVEGEVVDTDKTQPPTTVTQTTTTTTTDTVTTTTVEPAKVTVTMQPVEDKKDEIGVTVTGATVLVKNDKDGGYAADIKLSLSGTKLDDENVTLTVKDEKGNTYETTLKVDANGSYTLEGINIEGLTGTQTVKLTLTGTQVEKVVNATTKAAEQSQKHFWNIGADKNKQELSKEEQALVETFLEKLEVTEDFVIYGEVFDQGIGHIDGNICVDQVNHSTIITIHDQMGPTEAENRDEIAKDYALNGYSYVGKVEQGVQIGVSNNKTDPERGKLTVVTGTGVPKEQVTYEECKFDMVQLDQSMFDKDGKLKDDAVKKMAEEHPELANIAKETQIKKNLEEIAAAGQALAQKIENNTIDADKAKILAVRDLLEQKTLSKDDVVSITIGIDTLTSSQNQNEFDSGNNEGKGDYLSQLINANKGGATIIINVDMSQAKDNNVTQVKVNKKMNGAKEYDSKAANLIWNFGDYDGTITFESTFSGKVVASKANLDMNYLQAGSVVGKKVSHNNELHMAMPYPMPIEPDDDEPKTNTTEKVITLVINPSDGSISTSTSGGDSSTEIKLESTTDIYMKEPVTPDTPPTTPDTPPTTPDTPPTTPDTPPTTPDTPPTTPDTPPTTPDTPDEPDTPDTDIPDEDVPLSDQPETDIPDEDVPLTDTPEIDIPDNDIPLASFPSDDTEIDIPDEDVPLADVPRTGDDSGMWDGLALLSVCGLIVLTRVGKRKVE